jgi:opacity protein-like surface antigen
MASHFAAQPDLTSDSSILQQRCRTLLERERCTILWKAGNMRHGLGVIALPLALLGGSSLAAQAPERAVVFQAFGGGASHLRNLNASGSVAHLALGYSLGMAIGIQANERIGFHADFTYARNRARGAAAFAGKDVERFFYGVHGELAFPTGSGLIPFAFGGGGAVTVQELAIDQTFAAFTKPAAMFGAGLRYAFSSIPFELQVEGKSLVYRWDRAGFSRTLWDLSYSLGFGYRFGF